MYFIIYLIKLNLKKIYIYKLIEMRSTIQSTMRIASSIIKTKQINNNRLNINISKIYGSQITSFSTKKGDIKGNNIILLNNYV